MILIRPVEPADASEWLRLRLALWPDADPAEQEAEIAHFLSESPPPAIHMLHVAFVCPRPEGGLRAMIELSIRASAPGCQTDRIGYIEGWYVDPDWRGKGLGRALVERGEAWARDQGCTEMASDTTPNYPLSPGAHTALGYQETERYYRKELS